MHIPAAIASDIKICYCSRMQGYLWLTVAFCANGAANVLLKAAGNSIDPAARLLPQLLTNVKLVIGLGIFAINVVFYFLALRALPLSVAYPIMVGMSFLIATTASVVIFREHISYLQYIGTALIIIGVTLATLKFS